MPTVPPFRPTPGDRRLVVTPESAGIEEWAFEGHCKTTMVFGNWAHLVTEKTRPAKPVWIPVAIPADVDNAYTDTAYCLEGTHFVWIPPKDCAVSFYQPTTMRTRSNGVVLPPVPPAPVGQEDTELDPAMIVHPYGIGQICVVMGPFY